MIIRSFKICFCVCSSVFIWGFNMKKILYFLASTALLMISFISLASSHQNTQMSCPSLADVQNVASLVKKGVYVSNYYPAGDSGPIYRIYADSSPSLPGSIIAWMNSHQKIGKPLLALRILKQQIDMIHWLSKPKVVTYHSEKKHGSIKWCQYSQSSIFQMGGVVLSPTA